MGNQAGSLPYDVGEEVASYSGSSIWKLHQGSKKVRCCTVLLHADTWRCVRIH